MACEIFFKHEGADNWLLRKFIISPSLVGKALSLAHKLYFFINPPCSAAAQWMAIKYISKVLSWVKLQQLVQRSSFENSWTV